MEAPEFYIHGFVISNFRSFREEAVEFGPFEKINVIIGANNSGKSNVLRYIRRIYPQLAGQSPAINVDSTDLPQSAAIGKRRFAVLVNTRLPPEYQKFEETLVQFLRADQSKLPAGLFWLSSETTMLRPDLAPYSEVMRRRRDDIYRIWASANNASGGTIEDDWMPGILRAVFKGSVKSAEIVFVPAYRRLQSRLKAYSDDYGLFDPSMDEKIIENLAEYSQPPYDQQEKKKEFRKIVDFIRRVMNEPALELEIPHDRQTITVHLHGKSLPIEALGTGIHELVLLASKAVMQQGSIVCIEEPELHFHPELQRQFMRFIHEETSNQYFITTHSAHIMDAVPCSVHRVYLEHGASRATRPISGNEKRAVCHELGYRPSDLLQSNCVVWVEGPSDRIYVNHWIKSKAPELVEGLHYSVMFYGGALRSHLSAEDAILDDLIALLPINRFPVMVMDSDKKSAHAHLNANKKRIREELKETGLCWVTDGREIENYIPKDVLTAAVSVTHTKAVSLASEDRRFGKPLDYTVSGKAEPITEGFDKVRIAKTACESPADFDVLDLGERVDELVRYIRRANRLIGTSA
ncbi:AAA family ATPase [Sinorhizobium meliloti]|nr:AAA family ATPase [Sinorhizobium meliloti]